MCHSKITNMSGKFLHAAFICGEGCVETCLGRLHSCLAGNHITKIIPKVSTNQGFPSQPQQQGWGSKLEVKPPLTLHCGVFKAPHRGKHFKWPQAMLIKYHCNLHSWYLVFLTCPWGWDFPWGFLLRLPPIPTIFFPFSLYLTFSFILFHWWNQALISRVCVSLHILWIIQKGSTHLSETHHKGSTFHWPTTK